jgi:hypothetical protein
LAKRSPKLSKMLIKVYSIEIEDGNKQGNSGQVSTKTSGNSQKKKESTKGDPPLKHSDSRVSNNTGNTFGDDDGIKVELKRKVSGSGKEVLKRKISDADIKMPKKATKLMPELFDDLLYGNEAYPEIDYHM